MAESNKKQDSDDSLDDSWVLASLETDQLVDQKRPMARRRLKGPELVVIWALRLYLIFMMTAVVFQIVHSGGR
jgi:hypothetical protein